jgi:transcriptional regulator with XRE-family HTH domain
VNNVDLHNVDRVGSAAVVGRRISLKQARKRKGWTQSRLAVVAKIDQATISRLESGGPKHPSHATVAALARALDVPLGDLTFTR